MEEKQLDDVKAEAIHQEYQRVHGMSADDAEFLANFSPAAKRKVMSKVDWRMMPILTCMYLISFLDRSNIG